VFSFRWCSPPLCLRAMRAVLGPVTVVVETVICLCKVQSQHQKLGRAGFALCSC